MFTIVTIWSGYWTLFYLFLFFLYVDIKQHKMTVIAAHTITEQIAVMTEIVTVWFIIVSVVAVQCVMVGCLIEELFMIKHDKFLTILVNQLTLHLLLSSFIWNKNR